MIKIAKATFLTYNTIGDSGDYPNGLLERNGHQAIIVQHPKGQCWGAMVNGREPVADGPTGAQALCDAKDEKEKQEMLAARQLRKRLVADLYSGIFRSEELATIDFVVVYVGANGSQGAIELAAKAGEKARFVMCDCNLGIKLSMIASSMGKITPFLECECGGRETMARLVEEFLETGNVGPC